MKRTRNKVHTITLLFMLMSSFTLVGGWREYFLTQARAMQEFVDEHGGWRGFAQHTSELLGAIVYEATEPYAQAMGIFSQDPRIAECEIFDAIHHKRAERLALLLAVEGINVNCLSMAGETPLLFAVNQSSARLVELLLAHPLIEVNKIGGEFSHYAALHSASSFESVEIVRLLLSAPGRDVNILDGHQRTPLINAIQWGRVEIVQELLAIPETEVNDAVSAAGATAYVGFYTGYTALMMAMYNNSSERPVKDQEEKLRRIARLLVHDSRTQINAVNARGKTALMLAVQYNKPEMVQELLVHDSIDIDMLDQEGCTAMSMARAAGHTQIVDLLASYQEAHDIMVKPAVP